MMPRRISSVHGYPKTSAITLRLKGIAGLPSNPVRSSPLQNLCVPKRGCTPAPQPRLSQRSPSSQHCSGTVIMAISAQASGYTSATKAANRAKNTDAAGSRQYHPVIIVRPGSQDKDQQRKREMNMTTN